MLNGTGIKVNINMTREIIPMILFLLEIGDTLSSGGGCLNLMTKKRIAHINHPGHSGISKMTTPKIT